MIRRYRPPRRRAAVLFLLALILVTLRSCGFWETPSAPESLPEGDYPVERVVDGDTLLLRNRARIRLLGIDAPETVRPNHPIEPWGKEASEFLRRATIGRSVRLEFDRERVDRYGRFLAYVWVEDTLLNEALLRAGLARAKLAYRYSSTMKTRFERAELAAQAERRGLWSERGQ